MRKHNQSGTSGRVAGMPQQSIEFLNQSGDGRTVTIHKPGDVLFSEGEPSSAVYYLQDGKAKETVVSKQGRPAMVNMLEEGRLFGINGVYQARTRTSTVTVIARATVTRITREAMLEKLRQPSFARFFNSYLIDQVSALETDKADLLMSSKPRRLARTLMALSHVDKSLNEARPIGPEITQDMLAAMLGTSRPYVNELLTRFREDGLIKYSGGTIEVRPALSTWLESKT